jgi:hypothetical protein
MLRFKSFQAAQAVLNGIELMHMIGKASSTWREFFVLGSQDETAGNQTCQAIVAADGSLTLRLRLPDSVARDGKHLVIPGVRFAYGHDALLAALASSRKVESRTQEGKLIKKRIGTPISYRFLRYEKAGASSRVSRRSRWSKYRTGCQVHLAST